MAGEVTKSLIGKIISELKDEDMKIMENYGIACNKLNRYQLLFMQKYLTSKRSFEIELTSGIYEYRLHPRILKVLKCNYSNTDIQLTTTDRIYNIILADDTEFTTGDIMTIEAFIRPLQKQYTFEGEEEPEIIASDIISLSVDPIIEEEYHPWLIAAVLSEYRKHNPEFMTFENVIKEVIQIQRSMWKINALGTSGFSNAIRRGGLRF